MASASSALLQKHNDKQEQQEQQQQKQQQRHNEDQSTTTTATSSTDVGTTTTTTTTASSWELTWPIWHVLSRKERKDLALQHGMKTIGEFEEYMNLHQAEALSSAAAAKPKAVAFGTEEKKQEDDDDDTWNKHVVNQKKDDDDDDRKLPGTRRSKNDESDSEEEEEEEQEYFGTKTKKSSHVLQQQQHTHTTHTKTNTNTSEGGLLMSLPEVLIVHHVLSYLDVDYHAVCALVHSSWASLLCREDSYHELCRRCYLYQSKRKRLNLSRFGHSFRTMLATRPRVRTGVGLYVLKYRHIKPIQRDMWTEIPIGTVLETVYYRYLYFLEDGRVLYALSQAPPKDIVKRIQRVKKKYCHGNNNNSSSSTTDATSRNTNVDKNLVWGRYQVSKHDVTVWANQSWCSIILNLRIVPSHQYQERYYRCTPGVGGRPSLGNFGCLELIRHRTTDRPTSCNFDFDDFVNKKERGDDCYRYDGHRHRRPGIVDYKVPDEWFYFLKDWRL